MASACFSNPPKADGSSKNWLRTCAARTDRIARIVPSARKGRVMRARWLLGLGLVFVGGPAWHLQRVTLMAQQAVEANRLQGALPRLAPKSPEEAQKTFRTREAFRLELLAAEPLVASPVALEYDENGRAYVVEMRDYPHT